MHVLLNSLRLILLVAMVSVLSACASNTQVARYHDAYDMDWQGRTVRIDSVQTSSPDDRIALRNLLAQRLQELGFIVVSNRTSPVDFVADIRDVITDVRSQTYETPVYDKDVVGYKTTRATDGAGTIVTTHEPMYSPTKVVAYKTSVQDIITHQLSLIIHDGDSDRTLFSASGVRDAYRQPGAMLWPEMLDAMLEDFPG